MVDSFVYDGIDLKESGFIIVSFNGMTNGNVTTDSQRNFNHSSLFYGKYQPFLTTTYDTPLTMNFQIMALPCTSEFNQTSNFEISLTQMRWLKTWLSRPEVHRLTFPNTIYDGIIWEGSFNVEEIVMGTKRIGAELTFTSNRPFGFTEVTNSATLSANGVLSIENTSDEYGYIYPDMTVTLLANGNLSIVNNFDNRETTIANCTSGEILTFDKLLSLSSSISEHNIHSDFNYIFQRINKSPTSGVNVLTFSIPCTVSYTIRPIRKVVMV